MSKTGMYLIMFGAICILISNILQLYNINHTYCDGWEKGYVKGYCYEVQNCIKPTVPICPIPKIGFETYQDGLDRGFVEGKENK